MPKIVDPSIVPSSVKAPNGYITIDNVTPVGIAGNTVAVTVRFHSKTEEWQVTHGYSSLEIKTSLSLLSDTSALYYNTPEDHEDYNDHERVTWDLAVELIVSNTKQALAKARQAKRTKAKAKTKKYVGDVVVPLTSEVEFTSGSEYYDHAIVVSVDPFVLVSESADMRWSSTIRADQCITTGEASADVLSKCIRRLRK